MYYLVDGSHLLHRIRFTPQAELKTVDGRPSGLVHGFLKSLIKISKDTSRQCKIIVAWDKSGSKFRTKLFSEYKASRYTNMSDEDRKKLEEYNQGRAILIDLLTALEIPNIWIHGVEGDDIITYLSMVNLGDQKIILSDDTDLLMLVNDSTKVYRPVKGEWYDKERYISEYELDPERYYEQSVMILSMTGTHNDVPGIKGIGPKTALQISRFLLRGEPVPDTSAKFKKFNEQIETYHRNLKLVDMKYSLDTDLGDGTIRQLIDDSIRKFRTSPCKFDFIQVVSTMKDLELKQCINDLVYLQDIGAKL